ncbi:hypothetical protein HDF22_005096 [Mucilaginibacter lappiensis]|uniref:Uncharacterized protein n=1 Tax=Mucilaginibacter lappiensis TaxID=354630 RepID=A0A841JJ33_9SPHI|nr:hypothetical protein [Mucilaginibacter lappiensis]
MTFFVFLDLKKIYFEKFCADNNPGFGLDPLGPLITLFRKYGDGDSATL